MKKKSITRRKFMYTTAAGAGGVAVFGVGTGNSLSAQMLGNTTARKRDLTVIKKVYMAKPVPTWPCPDIDIQAEMKKIDAALADLQKQSDRKIKLVGGELLRTVDDVPAFKRNLGDADGILAFNLTSTCHPMINEIVDMGFPTVLFSQPYSGHDWSLFADKIKSGQRVDVVSSSDFDDLQPFLRIFDTIRKTKQSRILCLRPSTKKNEDIDSLEKHYGMSIEMLDYSQLHKLYQESNVEKATELADTFISGAIRMVEPKRKEVIKSMRLYLAIQELMEQYGSEVITIDCLGGFRREELPAYPCISWTLLNNAGKIGVCEADLTATMTQVLLQYLTGKPGFVSDPVIDTKTNTVIHAHCTSATKMDGPEKPEAPYIIRTHMEDNKGVAVQVKMRIGQEITLAKLQGVNKMLLSTGEIIDNPDCKRGCRTKVTTKVADADKMLHGYTGGLHRLLFYGNHIEDIKKMGRLMGFEVVEEI